MPFAPTLDQVGGFARTVESAAWLCAAMTAEPLDRWWDGPSASAPRLAAVRTKDWEKADEPMRARFQQAIDALGAAGRAIEWPPLPTGVDDGVAALATIMRFEGARSLLPYVRTAPERVSRTARTFFAEGDRITAAEHERALRERDRLVAQFTEWASPYDAVLTLAAIGEAPGLETTGDPIFCSRWTLVGAPAVAIPVGRGPAGLPLGLQLVGAPGDDKRLLAAAAWAERVVSGW
jgi:Asp-tRNA(Asn)/Glu-tRNA(Gln) amidotransferase A subunit family amidase